MTKKHNSFMQATRSSLRPIPESHQNRLVEKLKEAIHSGSESDESQSPGDKPSRRVSPADSEDEFS